MNLNYITDILFHLWQNRDIVSFEDEKDTWKYRERLTIEYGMPEGRRIEVKTNNNMSKS